MNDFKQAKRIVIKVGTSTLAHHTGRLNLRRVEHLVRVISDLKNSGLEIILVSSGAIGVGMGRIGLASRPADVRSQQACAAIGQCELMSVYDKQFSEYNHVVSQVLLTEDVVRDELRKQNVINTFERLIEFGSIPVVNENDTVSVDEMDHGGGKFGDNDTLSAIVAGLVHADGLIILTDVEGLYDKDPVSYSDAKLISVVNAIDDSVRALAGESSGNLGTGGMVTKIKAAEMAMHSGILMGLINGAYPDYLYDLIEGKKRGTLFLPQSEGNDELY